MRETFRAITKKAITGQIRETLRREFRAAVNAITHKAPAPEPKPSRRKQTDETRGGFKMAARITHRAARLPREAYAVANAYLTDTLDWLNQWHHHDAEEENSHTIQGDHLYPHL